MPNKAIKYRLYPTNEQSILFMKTFGCCRKVYNLMLSDKIKSYAETGKFASVSPAMYKADHPFLKEVDSLALANTWTHLQSAFRNCFDKSRKKRNKFPRFKSAKRSKRSYTTNDQHGTIAVYDDAVKLPKLGRVKAVIHRKPDDDWRLKSATVSRESTGKYYVSILFEYDVAQQEYKPDLCNAIGLDYASDGLYVDSDGNKGTQHKYYRESERKLAKAQRRLSRKRGSRKNEKRSKNYDKQLMKVNKIHRHIANQRLDTLHKFSTEIANRYDVVCVETLNMRAMANKGFGNGKAINDNGYGMFLCMLEYKLKDRNKYLVKVDKWFPSSQLCHNCGQRHVGMKDLRMQYMRCSCGYVEDRNVNAAKNILCEGIRMLKEDIS